MILSLLFLMTGATDTVITAKLPTLSSVKLVRSRVAVLQSDSLDFVLAAAISGGDIVVAGLGTNLMRFDLATGRLIATLTRQGDGPGEVRSPLFLHSMKGDSLFLYDQNHRRVSVFGPRTFKYIRGIVIPARSPTAVFPVPSGVLLAASRAPAEGVGYPFHLYGEDGKWLRSFGNEGGKLRWDGTERAARLAGPADRGGVWAVSQYGQTVVERWGDNGTRAIRIQYDASAEPPAVSSGPKVQRYGIVQFSPETVLVLTLIADRNWRRGTVKPPGRDPTHGAAPVIVGSRAHLWDSVLDLIDANSGSILVRLRLDEWVSHVLPGGYLIVHSETPDGEPIISVERLTVVSTSRR